MSRNSLISVVIVSFNNARSVAICINSILKYEPELEVIVVDNASNDQTINQLREFKKKIKIIESQTNLGFAKGCNLGAKSSSGEYLVFLNPDTRIKTSNSLTRLTTSLRNNSDYGLIGPKFVFPNGESQPTVRSIPTVTNAISEYIFKMKGSYDFYKPDCSTLCSVQTVVGACMAISKKLFHEVGGFDEKYFLYYEDIDLCQRILNKGLKIGYNPEVTLEHMVGESGKSSKTTSLLNESARKYHGLVAYILLQIIFRASRLIGR